MRDLFASLAGRATGTGEPVVVRAPFTGEPVASVPGATVEDVREAVRRARAAQAGWAAWPVERRAGVLRRFRDLVLARRKQGLDLIQLEGGKARRYAFEEIGDAVLAAGYYGHHAAPHLRPKRRRGALPLVSAAWELRHPVGVVGFICPWNFPLVLSVSDALPALVAGNAVVLKADAQTPFTALWAARALDDAGLPTDVLQVIVGDGPLLGPPLIEGVDYVSFTGSTRTGRIIAHQAAERLIGRSLELGGKNAMLVLDDADVDSAVGGAIRGCFGGAGQICVSLERLYVHAAVYERFAAAFVARTRRLKLGAELDYSADVGSLANAGQLTRVDEHVRDAVAKGARVLAGGRARPEIGPYVYEPTILEGATEAMALYAEETFGPVVALYRVGSADEAVQRANDSQYGLAASVWSRSERRALAVASRVQAGSISVNEGYTAAWGAVDAPMGGFKESGLGRRHGAQGLLKYTQAQTLAVQRLLPLGLVSPPVLGPAGYSRVLAAVLWLLDRIPGLR